MLNLNSIMVGSMQQTVMADFYTKVFGKPADMTEGNWHGWSVGFVSFQWVSTQNAQEKQQTQLE